MANLRESGMGGTMYKREDLMKGMSGIEKKLGALAGMGAPDGPAGAAEEEGEGGAEEGGEAAAQASAEGTGGEAAAGDA